MTKVEAIVRVMQANGGKADLQTIYREIGRYYKGAKASTEWAAGIRGVLYREIRNGRTFCKTDGATYALAVGKPLGRRQQSAPTGVRMKE